jgi:hypothetical protein
MVPVVMTMAASVPAAEGQGKNANESLPAFFALVPWLAGLLGFGQRVEDVLGGRHVPAAEIAR